MNGVDGDILKKLYEFAEDDDGTEAKKLKNSLEYLESQKPFAYQSEYAKLSDKLLDEYLNKEKFSYNPYTDASYVSYANRVKKDGKNAMKDTLARASELSGGYLSSYGENAAASAYNSYLEKLADAVADFEKQAYSRYENDRNYAKDKVDLVSSLDKNAYSRYKDEMSDFYKDREYFYDKYEDAENRYAADRRNGISILEKLASLENEDFYKLLNAKIKMMNNK